MNRSIPVPLEAMVPGPNVIGATGGSGTRVVARIVRSAGMFIGTDLNDSEDSLRFGDYSDQWINRFIAQPPPDLPGDLESEMDNSLEEAIRGHLSSIGAESVAWGWKEPRSIYLLPFFHSRFPALKFLHVVRDGRDMALSSNQNQLRKHGAALLAATELATDRPGQSIALWNRINLLRADYGENQLRDHYLRIRFEDLCSDPVPVIRQILDFFELPGDPRTMAGSEVHPPGSVARWRNESPEVLEELHEIGGAALKRFGYCP